MYLVTQDYKDAIYADARSVTGRVTFDISPGGIENDTPTVTASSQFFISKAATQLTDNIRQATYSLVTWEFERTKLDGTFTFAADDDSLWGEVGWVSGEICNANNQFATTLTGSLPANFLAGASNEVVSLEYTNTYTSAGVTVTFDPLFGEYATDFSVTAFDPSNNIVFYQNVTGNTNTQFVIMDQIVGFDKLTVSISKWSHPYRRARISEVDAGVVLVYTDDELIRMNMTEEMDIISGTLVIPEFEFTVNNIDGEFDILNPSGIYQSLQLRQRIQAELGLVLTDRTEWVPLGVYYLSEWKSDTGSLTATFTGRSKIDLLDVASYENTTPIVGHNLYLVIEDILLAAGITGYIIDTDLQSIPTTGLVEKMTCREALQMAAIAGQARIWVTRNDVLMVEVVNPLTVVVDDITLDDVFEEPKIELGKPVKTVQVFYYSTIGTADGSYTETNPDATTGETIVLQNNTLITSATEAENVAIWIFGSRDNQKIFTIDYRGNPALELNDTTFIETRYVAQQPTILTKIDVTYEGYLTSQIKGKA